MDGSYFTKGIEEFRHSRTLMANPFKICVSSPFGKASIKNWNN